MGTETASSLESSGYLLDTVVCILVLTTLVEAGWNELSQCEVEIATGNNCRLPNYIVSSMLELVRNWVCLYGRTPPENDHAFIMQSYASC